LTVEELARRIRQSVAFTQELLADWREQGIAEERDGRWYLTADGFRRYGRAILDSGPDDWGELCLRCRAIGSSRRF